MSPKPLQKPNRPNTPKSKTSRPQSQQQTPRKDSNNNRGGNLPPESPWIKHEPNPDDTASFVEYLRWMRPYGGNYDDVTKVQIMQLAQSKADYGKRLEKLTERTKLIAGKNNQKKNNWFEIECPWRIRVGGHRGPESMLLPAFDSMGMPYLPSSTLRGVARTQAIKEKMLTENINWETAQKLVTPYFGSLEGEENNRMGKVTFLDAYPLPIAKEKNNQVEDDNEHKDAGGLMMDIATNIWKWDGDKIKYETNPNPFFSLKKTKFVIGLRLSSNCQDEKVLVQVKEWLIKGLEQGIGSQVNTGYGELRKPKTKKNREREFFRLRFNIEGQLIHGYQEFNNVNDPYKKDKQNGNYKYSKGKLIAVSQAIPEVRPTAFKSMLRYWFRVFSLGVLPPNIVKEWEGKLFGSIDTTPPTLGWVKVNIELDKLIQSESKRQDDFPGEQQGILTLSYSVAVPSDHQKSIGSLLKTLMWLMLNLGGVGQGSRRPCYSRPNKPWHRGCTFYLDGDLEDGNSFWYAPESPKEFQKLLKRKIREFYTALGEIIPNSNLDRNIQSPLNFGSPTTSQWYEAIDINCRIIVCSGTQKNRKPYALATLHNPSFKIQVRKRNGETELKYNGNLCGETGKPSPVWITQPFPIWDENLDDYKIFNYQVVTVFGATASPRDQFLQLLEQNSDEYHQVFPFQL